MKIKYLLVLPLVLFFVSQSYSQSQYPLVTIQQIQQVPDSLLGTDPPSPLNGDTVRIRALVMVRPVVDPITDRRTVISAGARWSIYVQDPDGGLWGGMNIIQHDTSSPGSQGTFLDLVDTAQVVEFTGVVEEFFTSTQMALITAPQPIPVEIIENRPKRADPIVINISDFWTTGGTYNFDAEKYEGMYVEIRNVITSDRVTGTGGSSGNFRINDAQGRYAYIYNQSRYFKSNAQGIADPIFTPPLNGSFLSYVRGIVTTRTDGYWIVPLYPGDVGPVTASAPVITQIRRDQALVGPNQAVTVSANSIDLDGFITSSRIHYRVNGGTRQIVNMTKNVSDTTTWVGTIPGVPDSALVDFYISSTDNGGNTSANPTDTVGGVYFYLVLNRPLTITDVQYSPFGSGFSAYNNFFVTLQGTVTADTSDLPGWGSTPLRVYMQDGSGPWTGIQIGTTGNLGNDVLNLNRGDRVTVNGKISESFNVTRIDSLTQLIVNSTGNVLPEPVVVTTGTIGTKANGVVDAEKWESVLIQYDNITVTDDNADGASGTVNNFGEIFVSDGSGNTRVELQDGNHIYHNGWDAAMNTDPTLIKVEEGNTFTSMKGVLFFSFNFYKLAPRKNDDFLGYSTNVEELNNLPKEYSLNQNYPNPFNPSTTITYSIQNEGMTKLTIYNLLGQAVKTLINEVQPAGSYKVSFDASSLPSGVYFYSLSSGNFQSVKKMLLIK